MTESNLIVDAIRDARRALALTQTELGERVGIPQSHISKIEKGGVDLKLSSLSEIARALDLELKLVPRRALPAVESSVRAHGAPDDTSRALAALDEQLAFAQAVEEKFPDLGETGKFEIAVRNLRYLRYTPPLWRALNEILRPTRELQGTLDALGHPGTLASYLSNTTASLRSLRNEALHQPALAAPQRPAHRLDAEEDE